MVLRSATRLKRPAFTRDSPNGGRFSHFGQVWNDPGVFVSGRGACERPLMPRQAGLPLSTTTVRPETNRSLESGVRSSSSAKTLPAFRAPSAPGGCGHWPSSLPRGLWMAPRRSEARELTRVGD